MGIHQDQKLSQLEGTGCGTPRKAGLDPGNVFFVLVSLGHASHLRLSPILRQIGTGPLDRRTYSFIHLHRWHRLMRAAEGRCPCLADYVGGAAGHLGGAAACSWRDRLRPCPPSRRSAYSQKKNDWTSAATIVSRCSL